MADPTGKSVKILFEGDASGAQTAGQQARDAIEGVKGSTEKLNESVAGEGAPDSEGIPGGVRGLHMALRLIAREAGPAAGAAVSAAAAAMTGGVMAAVVAVQELFNWLGQLQKKAEEFRQQQDDLWTAAQQGARDARDAAKEFADKLDDANTKSDKLKTTFEDQKKLLNDQIEQHKKLLDAFEKEALAAVKGDQAKETAVKQYYEQLKGGYDLQAEREKIALEQRQLGELQIRKAIDATAAEQLELLKENLVAGSKTLDENLKSAKEKAKGLGLDTEGDVQTRAAKLQDMMDSLNRSIAFEQGRGMDTTQLMVMSEKTAERLAALKAVISAQQAVTGSADALTAINRGLGKAEGARDTDIGQADALIASIKDLTAALNTHFADAARERAVGMISGVAAVDTALVAGKSLTQSQVDTVVAMQTLLNQAHENSKAILQLILAGVRKHESVEQIIREVQSQMENMAQHTLSAS